MIWNENIDGINYLNNQFEEDIFKNDIEFNKIDINNFLNNHRIQSNDFDNMSELNSIITNNEVKISNFYPKKKLFNVKQDTKNNVDNNNNSILLSTHSKTEITDYSFSNNNEIKNDNETDFLIYQNLSLSERMKIKKEKAKKNILEKKTRRNEQNNINLDNLSNEIPLNEDSEKEKERKNNNNNINNKTNQNQKNKTQSKKEIKMLRNRLSAQKSRDKKKKEFEHYKKLTQDLMKENKRLKEELEKRDIDISKIKESIKSLCPECKKLIFEKNIPSLNECCINNTKNEKRKYTTLITGIIAILCFIGTFIYGNNNFQNNENQIRKLNENINCNQIIPYDNVNKYLNLINETNKQINPFKIVKDYTMRKKKFLEDKTVIVYEYDFEEKSNNYNYNYNNSINENNYLICSNFYTQSERLFDNLYVEKVKKDNAITQFNQNNGEKYLGFEDKNIFVKLIVPVSKFNNETSIQVDSLEKGFYIVTCKIVDIKKEYKV